MPANSCVPTFLGCLCRAGPRRPARLDTLTPAGDRAEGAAMSDERDEAPRSSPAADSGRTDGDSPADDAPRVSARAPVDDPALDDTLPGNSRLDDTLPGTESLDDLAESQPATTPLP